jgi:hypothetical protein
MIAQVRLVIDHPVAECGGAISGVVSWSGNRRRDRVGVVLVYRTEGRGEADDAVAAQCELGVADSGQARFRLEVPLNGPVTYHGQLLRVLWQAAVRIPVTRSFGLVGGQSADLTVVPRGWPPGGSIGEPR